MRSPLRSFSSVVSSGSSHLGFPARSRSSSCASQSAMIFPCATSSACNSVSSGTSSAPASTIVRPCFVPTTIRSSVEVCVCGSVGLTTSSPSIMAMRTAPTGPMKGSGDSINAAEAPLMQRMSCGVTRSADSVVQITCTSLR